jgi:hypothetical protein
MSDTCAVLETKNGSVQVEFVLSDSEVAGALAQRNGEFPQSLARSYPRWSPKQRAWAHHLAAEKPQVRPVTGGLESIVAMFEAASSHKKFPRIEFRQQDGSVIRVSRAGSSSKYPGSLNVTDGRPFGENQWYGRIALDGTTTISDPQVLAFLQAFSANPIEVAREYGRQTGYCCFCGRLLTDARSVENGFGPVCAEHYGLSW